MLEFRDSLLETGLGVDALSESIGITDTNILNYAKSTSAAEMSVSGFTKFINKQTLAAKAGSIAMKGLALAGNMLATWAISKVIELVKLHRSILYKYRQRVSQIIHFLNHLHFSTNTDRQAYNLFFSSIINISNHIFYRNINCIYNTLCKW